MSTAQKKAGAHHRERLKRRGLVRLEVLAPEADAALIRDVVKALRDDPARAAQVRARLRDAIGPKLGSGLAMPHLGDGDGVNGLAPVRWVLQCTGRCSNARLGPMLRAMSA